MNQRHISNIRTKLIPFILREHGSGFGMSTWISVAKPGTKVRFDDVTRRFPCSGTVACIGGSVELLSHKHTSIGQAKWLGLTDYEYHILCHRWEPSDCGFTDYHWPLAYVQQFKKAKNSLAKAKVAVRLLEEVIRTKGKCLHSARSQHDLS